MATSDSHRIAAMKQDNGELQEDVVERDLAEAGDARGAGRQSAAEVDRQSVESFPASDAPSTWAGPPDASDTPPDGEGGADGDRAERASRAGIPPGDLAEGPADSAGRVVHSEPAPEVPERAHPADPVPGTLPDRRG